MERTCWKIRGEGEQGANPVSESHAVFILLESPEGLRYHTDEEQYDSSYERQREAGLEDGLNGSVHGSERGRSDCGKRGWDECGDELSC